jgi:hypothetical protein
MDLLVMLVGLGWTLAFGAARLRVQRRVIPVGHPLLALRDRNG